MSDYILLILGILLFTCILLINHWLVWLGIALGTMIVMAEMSKSISDSFTQKELKRFVLPLMIIVVSLVFVFVKPSFQKIAAIPGEITPTFQITVELGFKTLKESFKNLILGSGPGTWGYQFLLYRPIDLNLTGFWQIRFSQGAAVLLNFLTVWSLSIICSKAY